LAKHSAIDFLKIDIEGLEQDVIKAITPELLGKIRQIQAETGEFEYHVPGYSKTQFGAITKYEKLP
jgi:hypothetical protein